MKNLLAELNFRFIKYILKISITADSKPLATSTPVKRATKELFGDSCIFDSDDDSDDDSDVSMYEPCEDTLTEARIEADMDCEDMQNGSKVAPKR